MCVFVEYSAAVDVTLSKVCSRVRVSWRYRLYHQAAKSRWALDCVSHKPSCVWGESKQLGGCESLAMQRKYVQMWGAWCYKTHCYLTGCDAKTQHTSCFDTIAHCQVKATAFSPYQETQNLRWYTLCLFLHILHTQRDKMRWEGDWHHMETEST